MSATEDTETSVHDEEQEKPAKRWVPTQPTPIFSYRPDILLTKDDPLDSMEVIKAELHNPHKKAHRKTIKMPLESILTVKEEGPEDGEDTPQDFVFKLDKKGGKSSGSLWTFPTRQVEPIIRDKVINKKMKEALYGAKWVPTISLAMGFDPYKVYNLGEPGCGLWRGVVQDFEKIRNYHLRKGTLFCDPMFPPSAASVTYTGDDSIVKHWRRPREIRSNAKLFVKGFTRFDINQGILGDCWFLAAISTLTLRHNLFLQVMPLDQSFTDKYVGVFHFRFWQYGRWIDVVIDDLLPVDKSGNLVFTASTDKNEYWPALLEKAYAKLHGSYEALTSGQTGEAMEDLTGGVTETYTAAEAPPNLFNIMLRAFSRGSLITMNINKEGTARGTVNHFGLVEGHSYTVSRVLRTRMRFYERMQEVQLVRLRNPWGRIEWNGPWSDGSQEWLHVEKNEKERVGLWFDHDGEFWMSYEDFLQHATYIDLCNLNPESVKRSRKWQVCLYEGEWVKGASAGGCYNFEGTFHTNPQYLIAFDEPDDKNTQLCTVVVSLMQKHRRKMREMGLGFMHIGFVVYHIADRKTAPKPLDTRYLYSHEFLVESNFVDERTVTKRLELPVGTYCIIPSTFDPGETGEFIIRVFSEQKTYMKENEEKFGFVEKPEKRICMCSPIKTNLPSGLDLAKSREKLAAKKASSTQPKPSPVTEPESPSPTQPEPSTDDKPAPPPVVAEKIKTMPRPKHHLEPPKIIAEVPKVTPPVPEVSKPTPKTLDRASIVEEDLLESKIKLSRIISKNPATQKAIEETFLSLSGDDEEINWEHLQKLLDIALKELPHYQKFNEDLCRSLLAFYDENQSGKLFFEEFTNLCHDIQFWTEIYYKHGTTSALTGDHLRDVVKEAGYKVHFHILNLMVYRYGNSDEALEFPDYVMCMIKLKNMMTAFKERDPTETDRVGFNLNDFMELVMYS